MTHNLKPSWPWLSWEKRPWNSPEPYICDGVSFFKRAIHCTRKCVRERVCMSKHTGTVNGNKNILYSGVSFYDQLAYCATTTCYWYFKAGIKRRMDETEHNKQETNATFPSTVQKHSHCLSFTFFFCLLQELRVLTVFLSSLWKWSRYILYVHQAHRSLCELK